MQVISDMEAVNYSDFQNVAEMMRYCKNSNQILQTLAKKSLKTHQMVMKTRIPYRKNLIQMFIEIYTADGHEGVAETLLQSYMANDAYSSNPILVSYRAILSIIKAICYTIEKKESYGVLDAEYILQDIISSPLRFYDVVLYLNSTSNVTSLKKPSTSSSSSSSIIDRPSGNKFLYSIFILSFHSYNEFFNIFFLYDLTYFFYRI